MRCVECASAWAKNNRARLTSLSISTVGRRCILSSGSTGAGRREDPPACTCWRKRGMFFLDSAFIGCRIAAPGVWHATTSKSNHAPMKNKLRRWWPRSGSFVDCRLRTSTTAELSQWKHTVVPESTPTRRRDAMGSAPLCSCSHCVRQNAPQPQLPKCWTKLRRLDYRA